MYHQFYSHKICINNLCVLQQLLLKCKVENTKIQLFFFLSFFAVFKEKKNFFISFLSVQCKKFDQWSDMINVFHFSFCFLKGGWWGATSLLSYPSKRRENRSNFSQSILFCSKNKKWPKISFFFLLFNLQ